MVSVNLAIVGGNRLFRESLALSFDKESDCSVVGQAVDVRACTAAIDEAPDIVLLDLERIDEASLRAIRHLRESFPSARTIVLVSVVAEERILACIQAGAVGYIRKDSASFTDVRRALRMVLTQRAPCEPSVAYSAFRAIERLDRRTRQVRQSHALEVLTHREFEVLRLIDGGLSNRQIAERLCLSVFTVKNHVHNILDKLEARDRRQAVAKAHENAWLEARSDTGV